MCGGSLRLRKRKQDIQGSIALKKRTRAKAREAEAAAAEDARLKREACFRKLVEDTKRAVRPSTAGKVPGTSSTPAHPVATLTTHRHGARSKSAGRRRSSARSVTPELAVGTAWEHGNVLEADVKADADRHSPNPQLM
jgi:hypothetical protein